MSLSQNILWNSIAEMARTQNGGLLETLEAGFKYIENDSFESTFQGLFSEINLSSEKLGKNYKDRNAKLCTIIKLSRVLRNSQLKVMLWVMPTNT